MATGKTLALTYLPSMTKDTRVLYNETCPICRFEVEGYRRVTEAAGKPVTYQGLEHAGK